MADPTHTAPPEIIAVTESLPPKPGKDSANSPQSATLSHNPDLNRGIEYEVALERQEAKVPVEGVIVVPDPDRDKPTGEDDGAESKPDSNLESSRG